MKQKLKLLVPLLTIISIVGVFVNVNAVSSDDTLLYVDHPAIYALPGESFTIDIKVSNVEFLHEWQVNMSFNPNVLQFINVTEGDFLLREEKETVGFANLDNVTDGWILFTWAILGQFSVSGSGTLASVEFEVLAIGESKLDLVTEPVWNDKDGDGVVDEGELIYMTHLIKVWPPPPPQGADPMEDIPFTAVDGFFFNLEPPPVAEFTYLPTIPGLNELIAFNASASSATAPLEIVEYHWDFGDGTTEIYVKDVNLTNTANHAYTIGGVYNVSLTVIDNVNVTGTLIENMYNTTKMPLTWYELHSTTTKPVSIRLGHDIAVTNVKASKQEVTVGETISINVTVLNKGIETENFKVSVYFDANLIETKSVTGLSPGEEKTLIFSWDTTGVAEGSYQIRAEATDVEGEGSPQDNEFVDGTITVKLAEQSFPTTLVIGAAVAVAVLAIFMFMYLRRRSTTPA